MNAIFNILKNHSNNKGSLEIPSVVKIGPEIKSVNNMYIPYYKYPVLCKLYIIKIIT